VFSIWRRREAGAGLSPPIHGVGAESTPYATEVAAGDDAHAEVKGAGAGGVLEGAGMRRRD